MCASTPTVVTLQPGLLVVLNSEPVLYLTTTSLCIFPYLYYIYPNKYVIAAHYVYSQVENNKYIQGCWSIVPPFVWCVKTCSLMGTQCPTTCFYLHVWGCLIVVCALVMEGLSSLAFSMLLC